MYEPNEKPPTPPLSPFFKYKQDFLKNLTASSEENHVAITADAAEHFKKLDNSVKEVYIQNYRKERMKYEEELESYVSNHGKFIRKRKSSQIEQDDDFRVKNPKISVNKSTEKLEKKIQDDYVKFYTTKDFEAQAKSLKIAITMNPSSIYKIDFDSDSLGYYLFREGAEVAWFWPDNYQKRVELSFEGISSIYKKPFIFFPTNVTKEIFTYLSNAASRRITLTCQKGAGKTFSLILFTILSRFEEDHRVFFIHNCEHFYKNPINIFIQELYCAFFRELNNDEKLLEDLQEIEKLDTKQQPDKLSDFLDKLVLYCCSHKCKVYIIIDQVNSRERVKKEYNSDYNRYADKLYGRLETSKGESRIIQISSLTNEYLESIKKDFEPKTLNPKIEEQYAREFINHRFLYINETTVQQILDLSSNNFLQIELLAKNYFSKDEMSIDFQGYELKTEDDLLKDFKAFCLTKDTEDRKKAMMLVYTAFRSDYKLIGKICSTEIDQRYIILSKDQVFPLFSMVETTLIKWLSDLEIIEAMCKLFKKNASVLGFILELVILRRNDAQVSFQNIDNKENIRQIKMGSKFCIMQNHQEIQANIKNEMYFIPKRFNYPAFDAFYVTEKEIIAIQVKMSFTEDDVNFYVTTLKDVKRKAESTKVYKSNSKEYIVKEVYRIAESAGKELKIAFISGDRRESEVFKPTCEIENTFFFSDANLILKNLNLEDKLIQLLLGK